MGGPSTRLVCEGGRGPAPGPLRSLGWSSRGANAARAAKAIVREVRGLSHGSAKWHTARVVARQRVSAEAREGLTTFDEHRPPAWVPVDDG